MFLAFRKCSPKVTKIFQGGSMEMFKAELAQHFNKAQTPRFSK